MLAINLNVGDVVLEDGGDVDLAVGNGQFIDSRAVVTSSRSISKKSRDLDMVDAIGGSGDPGGFGRADQGLRRRRGVLPQGRYPWRKHYEAGQKSEWKED